MGRRDFAGIFAGKCRAMLARETERVVVDAVCVFILE
jgi:hypothetical protein